MKTSHGVVRFAVAALVFLGGGFAADTSKTVEWKTLFDGTLKGWKASDFYKPGEVKVDPAFRDGGPAIVLDKGTFLTGVAWNGPAGALLRNNYEVEVQAMKVDGGDFFCGLTFPVRDSACTLIAGGWGGSLVGLSSIDDSDASDNETSQTKDFATGRWYTFRVRVTDAKIEAWIDQEKVIDFETAGRRIGLRFGEIDQSLPLGVAAYQTKAAIREIRIRSVTVDR